MQPNFEGATEMESPRQERMGMSSPLLRGRAASPRPQVKVNGKPRHFVDYKMEAAPSWDGEQPEVKYKEHTRNLRLWLYSRQRRGCLLWQSLGVPARHGGYR